MRCLFSAAIAIIAGTAWLLAGAAALAGTTGALSGVVTSDGKPVAGVKITATSPSGIAVATTDASGHFTFASLAPDDYTLVAEKNGYDRASFGGAVVFADATQVVTLQVHKTLLTIANTVSRARRR